MDSNNALEDLYFDMQQNYNTDHWALLKVLIYGMEYFHNGWTSIQNQINSSFVINKFSAR